MTEMDNKSESHMDALKKFESFVRKNNVMGGKFIQKFERLSMKRDIIKYDKSCTVCGNPFHPGHAALCNGCGNVFHPGCFEEHIIINHRPKNTTVLFVESDDRGMIYVDSSPVDEVDEVVIAITSEDTKGSRTMGTKRKPKSKKKSKKKPKTVD